MEAEFIALPELSNVVYLFKGRSEVMEYTEDAMEG